MGQLKTVILANGKYWTEEDGAQNIDHLILITTRKGHYIREEVSEHVLFACAGDNFASLIEHRGRKTGSNLIYTMNFLLPEGEDHGEIIPAAIVDNHSSKFRYYEPAWFKEKKDYGEYFRIMKEVISELISIIPEPTQIPPAFNY